MGWVESTENWLNLPFLEATTPGLKGEAGSRAGLVEPGQEWGPFPLEILDALSFPRPLPQSEEAGRGQDSQSLEALFCGQTQGKPHVPPLPLLLGATLRGSQSLPGVPSATSLNNSELHRWPCHACLQGVLCETCYDE